MKNPRSVISRRHFAVAVAAVSAPFVHAADRWPSKPIRIVVPFTTGGSLDIMMRAIGQEMTKSLGQPVVIDNKSGAGGGIGTAEVARAAPDGYTFVAGTIGTHVVNQLTMKSLPYDSVKSFTPISLIQSVPMVLAVNPRLGITNVKEFLAYAKAKDENISIAAPSNAHYLGIVRLGQLAGVKFRIIPYRGPSQSMADAMGGHISAVMDTGMAILPHASSGGLTMLAIASRERLPMFEKFPTLMESGVPGFELAGVNSLYAPAGLPNDIVEKLSTEIRRIVALPAISEIITSNAGVVVNSTPQELAQWQSKETAIWRETIKTNNLTFE